MRVVLITFLLAALCTSLSATAQSLVVDESNPAPGAVDIPLETQISFTFSEEVAVTNDWTSVITVEPRDSIQISRVALFVDDESVPRIVTFTIRQTPQTDFSWLVHGVETFGGEGMAEPFVLRYTTASEMGPRTVSGSVLPPSAAKHGQIEDARAGLKAIAETLAAKGTPLFRPLSPNAPASTAEVAFTTSRSVLPTDYTKILLLSSFSVIQTEWNVSAASAVLGESGSYEIEFVRSGIYYPVAVHYSEDVIDALGFYDEDGDGMPDRLNVGSLDRQGIDIQMHAFSRMSAEAYVDRARASYPGGQDDDLVLIADEYGATPSGTAYVWAYDFYDADQNRLITVEIDPLLEQIDAVTAPNYAEDMTSIGQNFVGSEAALETVLQGSGENFLAGIPERDRLTIIEGGNQYWLFDYPESRTLWRVRFFNVRSGALYEAFVDMENGRLVTGIDGPIPSAAGPTLGPNFPNPFGEATKIPISIQSPASVHLTIYNVLGQRIVQLLSGEVLAPGKYTAEWIPDGAAPGLYVCELRAGEKRETRLLLLQRGGH